MSTPSESEPALNTHFEVPRDSGDSKSSTGTTGAADNVSKERHDTSKSGTVEQDTAGDDSLQGSLNASITSEDHPAAMSGGSSPTMNVGPDADLPVPEIVASPQGADEGEDWIPKGPHQDPNATPKGQTPKPVRPPPPPPKPRRDN